MGAQMPYQRPRYRDCEPFSKRSERAIASDTDVRIATTNSTASTEHRRRSRSPVRDRLEREGHPTKTPSSERKHESTELELPKPTTMDNADLIADTATEKIDHDQTRRSLSASAPSSQAAAFTRRSSATPIEAQNHIESISQEAPDTSRQASVASSTATAQAHNGHQSDDRGSLVGSRPLPIEPSFADPVAQSNDLTSREAPSTPQPPVAEALKSAAAYNHLKPPQPHQDQDSAPAPASPGGNDLALYPARPPAATAETSTVEHQRQQQQREYINQVARMIATKNLSSGQLEMIHYRRQTCEDFKRMLDEAVAEMEHDSQVLTERDVMMRWRWQCERQRHEQVWEMWNAEKAEEAAERARRMGRRG
ncbi:uncharacterized protein HMPREF1541_02493 [Cyphellophora europaea CBS 101466]|uniref:Uncharacterized protein n=1 Tax=Cyphellophora europaea (strain CBS 101466) TaxID=1220924 RepID=W2S5W9_CYPE1|nr:uncharacterized protein HMPREF1541_02493 [Cyphellophora europaea CBS 101466]ETN43334.1 hypothetical protein HMPREF1541_02493 [Cyphellophora europaea CBS 101466]